MTAVYVAPMADVGPPSYALHRLLDIESNYLRVFMVAARRKLQPEPCHPRCLITEPGVGLRFIPERVPSR